MAPRKAAPKTESKPEPKVEPKVEHAAAPDFGCICGWKANMLHVFTPWEQQQRHLVKA